MKTNVRAVLGFLGIGLLAILVVPLTNHSAGASGSAPVMVTNTPLPVDVGTPSVNVANTPTVNLNGVPSMLAANSNSQAVPVRDLDNPDPAANRFLVELCVTVFTVGCSPSPNSFAVDPTLRGLVIEYVSGFCTTDSTTGVGVVSVVLQTIAGGAAAFHYVVQSSGLQNDGSDVRTYFGQQTRLYADPGSTVVLGAGAFSPGPAPKYVCDVVLSGHTLK